MYKTPDSLHFTLSQIFQVLRVDIDNTGFKLGHGSWMIPELLTIGRRREKERFSVGGYENFRNCLLNLR